VTGGSGNTAGGVYGTVCGGVGNSTGGNGTVVVGGHFNEATALRGVICGGEENSFIFPAQNAVVGGGFQRSTGGDHDWVAGTLFEDN